MDREQGTIGLGKEKGSIWKLGWLKRLDNKKKTTTTCNTPLRLTS